MVVGFPARNDGFDFAPRLRRRRRRAFGHNKRNGCREPIALRDRLGCSVASSHNHLSLRPSRPLREAHLGEVWCSRSFLSWHWILVPS
jgi:hypothetical protein